MSWANLLPGGSSDGPAATSFESPRKVGWLNKQGGSGVISHWKKRWFIADHHYLFYYKKPDDKKPVGILCLPEYDSCHKSDGKEFKKPNTFILDKGNDTDAADGPAKSYVLQSDSDDDMREWIKALLDEMKSMEDGNKQNRLPNGRNQVPVTKKKGTSKEDTVDPRAFNELSAIVSDGPKLTHLTASRPKVKNRRPPKRYAVFHEEDDDKEDESPPVSPALITKALPPSPSTYAKKGQRPSTPLIPNKPKPSRPNKTEENSEAQTSEVKKRPLPPKKPSKDHFEPSPSGQPKEHQSPPPVASTKPRPTPPRKLSKVDADKAEMSRSPPPSTKPRPQPPIKPRVQAAPTSPTPVEPVTPVHSKPRTPTGSTAPTLVEPVTPVHRPKPVPRKRTMTSSETPPTTPTVKEVAPTTKAIQEELEETEDHVTIREPATPSSVEETTPKIEAAMTDNRDMSKNIEEESPQNSPREEILPLGIGDKAEVEIDEVKMSNNTDSEQSGDDNVPNITGVETDTLRDTLELGTDDEELNELEAVKENETTELEAAKDLFDGETGKDLLELGAENGIFGTQAERDIIEAPADKGMIEVPTEKSMIRLAVNKPSSTDKVDNSSNIGENKSDNEEIYEDMDAASLDQSKESTPECTYEVMDFEPIVDTPSIQPAVVRNNYDMVPTENFSSCKTVDISVGSGVSLVPQPRDTADKHKQESIIRSLSLNSPGYEKMDPASPAIGEEPQSPDGYVDVTLEGNVTMFSDGAKNDYLEYDEPDNWKCVYGKLDAGNYDVPKPLRPASGEKQSHTSSSRTESGDLSEVHAGSSSKRDSRSASLVSSSGSTSSKKVPSSPGPSRTGPTDFGKITDSDSPHVTEQRDRRTGSSLSRSERCLSPPITSDKALERDVLGYTRVKKNSSDIQTSSSFSSELDVPPELPPMKYHPETILESSTDSIPGTLKQIKEILRLAHVVRLEAEEMKEEAERELELARRERHDAELLKKNAAQILKMAKERLQTSRSS